jgi:hypothetical protein
MQKIQVICDDMTRPVDDMLEDGWKIVKIVTCPANTRDLMKFYSLIVLEKEDENSISKNGHHTHKWSNPYNHIVNEGDDWCDNVTWVVQKCIDCGLVRKVSDNQEVILT